WARDPRGCTLPDRVLRSGCHAAFVLGHTLPPQGAIRWVDSSVPLRQPEARASRRLCVCGRGCQRNIIAGRVRFEGSLRTFSGIGVSVAPTHSHQATRVPTTTPFARLSELALAVEDEGHLQVDLIGDDLAVVDLSFLFLHPGASHVPERLVRPFDPLHDGVLEAFRRRRTDFYDSGY